MSYELLQSPLSLDTSTLTMESRYFIPVYKSLGSLRCVRWWFCKVIDVILVCDSTILSSNEGIRCLLGGNWSWLHHTAYMVTVVRTSVSADYWQQRQSSSISHRRRTRRSQLKRIGNRRSDLWRCYQTLKCALLLSTTWRAHIRSQQTVACLWNIKPQRGRADLSEKVMQSAWGSPQTWRSVSALLLVLQQIASVDVQ